MAQLNDLLVMGPSTVLNDLHVQGIIYQNNKEVLTKEAAEQKYITASVSGNTLTIYIP